MARGVEVLRRVISTGSANKHMVTWDNLIHLRKEEGEDGEEWMTDPNTDWWHGLQPPTFRGDWDVCGLVGCTGSSLQVGVADWCCDTLTHCWFFAEWSLDGRQYVMFL